MNVLEMSVDEMQTYLYPYGTDLSGVEIIKRDAGNDAKVLSRTEMTDGHKVIVYCNMDAYDLYDIGRLDKKDLCAWIDVDERMHWLCGISNLEKRLLMLLPKMDVVRLLEGDYWYFKQDVSEQIKEMGDKYTGGADYILLDGKFNVCGRIKYREGLDGDHAGELETFGLVEAHLENVPKFLHCKHCRSYLSVDGLKEKLQVWAADLKVETYGEFEYDAGELDCPVCGGRIEFNAGEYGELVDWEKDDLDE